jgi:uncharacterized membrane protein
MHDGTLLTPGRFSITDIADAIVVGVRSFRRVPGPSVAFASVFALIGLFLLAAVGRFGISPMALPFAGGFLLVGPALLTGFFHLAALSAGGHKPRLRDALAAFARAPSGLWAVAGICTFLFVIWMTDAAVLYAFMIGAEHLPYDLPWLISMQRHVVAFELWGSLMGSVLAFIIFSVSAFSVPLLHEGRANLVQAVNSSVRAVLGNLLPALAWGLLLTVAMVLSIVLLPLLTVVLPVLAYASFAIYEKVFPRSADSPR